MIRSLRWKFIISAMLSLLGTLAFLCIAINVGHYFAVVDRMDKAIRLLYQNNGIFPMPDADPKPMSAFDFQVRPETPFETRYVIVKLTDSQEVRSVNMEHVAALDRQTVLERISRIMDSGAERGFVDYYRFGVFQNEGGGSTIIGIDCFLQLQETYNMIRITLIVSLACAVIVFVLLVFGSKRVIRPFVENLERQRKFVTDASHELKTPLAILSADMGLLEDSYGKNRWLESAQVQISRLDRLIRNLVELARTEETVAEESVTTFCVSEVAWASVDAFQSLAESAGKALTADIAGDVRLQGIQDNLFRLFSILLDNAVKYCDPGGTIHLSLIQRRRNVYISISNPCAGVDTSRLPRYFDRFYRADSSRARTTGGYGIGLSTARAIVTRHRGRITARYANGIITFFAVIPQFGIYRKKALKSDRIIGEMPGESERKEVDGRKEVDERKQPDGVKQQGDGKGKTGD